MLKPVCSNCILYNTDCRTSIIRRKANPARVRGATKPQQQEEYVSFFLSDCSVNAHDV